MPAPTITIRGSRPAVEAVMSVWTLGLPEPRRQELRFVVVVVVVVVFVVAQEFFGVVEGVDLWLAVVCESTL
jgi:hypothetical protein